jgi:hypothetical protein
MLNTHTNNNNHTQVISSTGTSRIESSTIVEPSHPSGRASLDCYAPSLGRNNGATVSLRVRGSGTLLAELVVDDATVCSGARGCGPLDPSDSTLVAVAHI